MSFQITKNQIIITKGDTFSLPIHFHQPINGAKILIEVFKEGALLPIIQKEITDLETAQKLMKFLDVLNEDDDVQRVITNADISEEIMAQLGE